jgi:hypothetical protein
VVDSWFGDGVGACGGVSGVAVVAASAAVVVSALVTVRGAELVDGRIVWGGGRSGAGVGLWSRVWRSVGHPAPLRLLEGERFILATRRHWCVPLKEVSGMGVMWPAVFLFSTVLDMVAAGVWFLKAAIWLGAAVHQVMVCHRVATWRSDLLVVTSKRLVQTGGVFSHSIKVTWLHQVRRCEVHQSFWGQLFRFGWLRLELDGVHDVGSEREFVRFVPSVGDVFHVMLVGMINLAPGRYGMYDGVPIDDLGL